MTDFTEKRVLMADDRPDAIKFVKDHLEEKGATVEVELTLGNALNKLKTEKFDLALIDLNLPPIPDELKPNIEKLRMRGYNLNQGQTLGVWLDEKKPNVKYAYITAYPIAFDARGDVPNQKNIKILDKSDRDECIAKVDELLALI